MCLIIQVITVLFLKQFLLLPVLPIASDKRRQRHTGMNSRHVILSDDLRVNVNLFQADLCRYYPGNMDVNYVFFTNWLKFMAHQVDF